MSRVTGTILIVDDEADTREILRDRLESAGYQVLLAASGQECLNLLKRERPQLILLDLVMPDMDGHGVLREIKKLGQDVTVVMITAHGTIEGVVQAMKEGAYDFIPKPFDPDHIAVVVSKALERESLKRNLELLSEQLDHRHQLIVGRSGSMQEAIERARRAAASKSTVLLLGESGTGKEIVARAIHNWSDRAKKPFVPINCVGLSRELLESELFGHERGAFTGALQLKLGKLELAQGGTVFLDEIGDISAELQTKLLRFLQEREFERVGGTRPISVDVRIIAATNRDLDAAVSSGSFRADLFYRLNVIRVMLPPLRHRADDIPNLAHHFLGKFAVETKKNFVAITDEALASLASYNWPGNVRELANVIESAVVLGQGPDLDVYDLPAKIVSGDSLEPAAAEKPESRSPTLLRPAVPTSLSAAIEQVERSLIAQALRASGGTKQKAAERLGLSRQGLIKKLKRYGMSR